MFLKFIWRALRYRKQRLTLAFAALAVAATLATVLFGIYGSVARRIRDEFRSYGANIVAVPANGGTLPLALAESARKLGAEAAPFLITSTTLNGRAVPVAGIMPDATRPLTTYWHIKGSRDIYAGECLAGELLHLELGTATPVGIVKGIVSTGSAEDNEFIVPWETAEKLAGLSGAASFIEIRVPGERLEAIRTALGREYPSAAVRTIQAVAETETSVVLKIRAALFLLTLVILAITTLCVGSNFSEMVLERAKEIGILKALGAGERGIAGFFVSESAALALLASVVGYVVGIFAAAAIGQEIFGGEFRLETGWFVPLAVTAVMLAVASLATGVATSRIWGIQPAIILRGE
jgi:putative ABC transport system permease protein